MFFSKSAIILAIVAFVVGAFSVFLGIGAAMGLLDHVVRASHVSASPDQVIAWGICVVLASVALGTLAEISLSMREVSDPYDR